MIRSGKRPSINTQKRRRAAKSLKGAFNWGIPKVAKGVSRRRKKLRRDYTSSYLARLDPKERPSLERGDEKGGERKRHPSSLKGLKSSGKNAGGHVQRGPAKWLEGWLKVNVGGQATLNGNQGTTRGTLNY